MSEIDPYLTEEEAKAISDKKLRAKLTEVNEIDDLKWLMGGKRGRRIVWNWLAAAGVFRLSFNHSGAITNLNEGRRSMGLDLLNQINAHCPELYLTMLQERNND